jgi:hypothetical protein
VRACGREKPEYLYLPASAHQIERTLLRVGVTALSDVQTPEEYGRYLIRESGHFDYDENLEGFYDYCGYGEQLVQKEGGQFNECGYVVYQGDVPLDELIQDSPAE